MMTSLHLLLLMLALVSFIVSACLPAYWNRFISIGLACWVGSLLF